MDERTGNGDDRTEQMPMAPPQPMPPPSPPGSMSAAPPTPTGPMSAAPPPPPSPTPGWVGPASAQPVWSQPAVGYSYTPKVGVTRLAKLGALVLILFGLLWAVIGGALLAVGGALTSANEPTGFFPVGFLAGLAAGIGIAILVVAIIEVVIGVFAWRGSGFSRFIGTIYALVFGIGSLLIALGGGQNSTDSTANTTSGVVILLVFAIGYLFTALAFIFRWKPRPAR